MAEVKFTEQSIGDLEEIASYISTDSPHYASLQIQKLIQRTNILEKYPSIGRVVPELKVKSIRELIEGNYRIIYHLVNKTMVHILTIHHSRKKIIRSRIRNILRSNK